MHKQRIYVQVVGFSDVERHALNTVFRLSEHRELAYALWMPLTAPGSHVPTAVAEVVLVDGDSAEAILLHAKQSPPGQRLIWVGAHPPDHAWRIVERPIQWANLLNDLDAVYAARQVESGFLDLDITLPGPLEEGGAVPAKRALVVGLSLPESRRLAEWLGGHGIVEVDRAVSTEVALEQMTRYRYCCGVFDLDEHHVDTWQLAQHFALNNRNALTMGVSEHAGPLAPWLNRRRVRRDTERTGINALVGRPLSEPEVQHWFDLL